MRAFLIAACSLAGGILVGLLISMVASPSINKLTAERNQLSAKLDSVERELSVARSELDTKQQRLEEANRRISALEHRLSAREKVAPPPATHVRNVPAIEQKQPPAKPMVSAAEKRFVTKLQAFLDTCWGFIRILEVETSYGECARGLQRMTDAYADIPEAISDDDWTGGYNWTGDALGAARRLIEKAKFALANVSLGYKGLALEQGDGKGGKVWEGTMKLRQEMVAEMKEGVATIRKVIDEKIEAGSDSGRGDSER